MAVRDLGLEEEDNEETGKDGVYAVEDPDGRVRFGETSDINRRFKEHLAERGASKLLAFMHVPGGRNARREIEAELIDGARRVGLDTSTRNGSYQPHYKRNPRSRKGQEEW